MNLYRSCAFVLSHVFRLMMLNLCVKNLESSNEREFMVSAFPSISLNMSLLRRSLWMDAGFPCSFSKFSNTAAAGLSWDLDCVILLIIFEAIPSIMASRLVFAEIPIL